MEAFNNVVSAINGVVWGPIMLFLLIGTHVLLSVRTKFIQRKTFTGVKLSVTPDAEASGDIGGFAALATALAATIGTGNIVGVATAVGTHTDKELAYEVAKSIEKIAPAKVTSIAKPDRITNQSIYDGILKTINNNYTANGLPEITRRASTQA